jgi:4-diphosphocytidyl-2-C-methyl-D-erythritol kinase
MKIIEKAKGKINLCLDVTSRRSDGYHNVESIMHTVDLYDTVTLELSDEISVSSDSPHVPTDSSNLAYKAAKLFFEEAVIKGGVSIHIEKRIPIAAGMAGGSTDGAAVLRGLNKLYNYPLNDEALEKTGAKLGADVPFCIRGNTEGVVGIGYDFIKVTPPPAFIYVIACGGEGISTPAMYKEYDKRYPTPVLDAHTDSFSGKSEKVRLALEKGDKDEIFGSMFNCFEEIAMEQRPKIKELKDIMMKNNARFSMMSGSGPSVFGIFDSVEDAKSAEKEILNCGAFAAVVFDEKE